MSAKRIGILFGGIALAFCALAVRLFQLQIVEDPAHGACLGQEHVIVIPAARGAILDRDGRLLRAERDAFDVHVVASTFREKNVADALADLALLLDPSTGSASPLTRGNLLQEIRSADPERAIARILTLPLTTALADEADDLHGRAAFLIEPEGTLVRPASHVRRRVQDALLVLAAEGGAPAREVRKKLRDKDATVGAAAGTTSAMILQRVRREDRMLERLGAELGLGDATEVRALLDHLCDRHYRRVEDEIERRVNDAICLQHWGSWNLDKDRMSEDEIAELRARSGVPADKGWKEVREALCRQVRAQPGFDRSRYLDTRKENQTKTELASFRGDDLGFGGSFALAGVVDGPAGLRTLGFELRASFARDDTRREKGGALALLLGEVTRHRIATGGVEERLKSVLEGKPGEARIAPDGAVTVNRAPQHGANAVLTVSHVLQERIQALDYRPGAAAVIDVRTGGILAVATWPAPRDGEAQSAIAELAALKSRGFMLQARIKEGDETARSLYAATWSQMMQSPGIHRAVTAEHSLPPGSTMKALTLLAGLEAGVISPATEIDCQTPPERKYFRCHKHGRLDLEGALERSCNAYCYETVNLLGGSAPLFKLYEKVGLFDAVPGLIPKSSGDSMRRAILDDDPRNLAIGQGSLSLPPVRLAGIAASVATGRVVHPHIFKPDGFEPIGPAFASAENLAVIRSGMRRVAIGAHGTAKDCRPLGPLGIAGKTGTAQLTTRNEEDLYAAWFVGFAPYESPRYAFAVLLDDTHDKGADAAPTAARLVDVCYEVLGGRP